MAKATAGKQTITFTGKGITSGREIKVEIEKKSAGHGIKFRVPDKDDNLIELRAHHADVINTLRNVTLGKDSARLCIVEHFLCATSIWGLEDLLVTINGPEFPLEDGSARCWIQLFKEAGWQHQSIEADLPLQSPVVVGGNDRTIIGIPDKEFSATYLIDWNHPQIGKRWFTWKSDMNIEETTDARTFGGLKEHQMLGIADLVVSMTEAGFSHELRYADEPVRHKVLDLIGDLALAGVNPLRWKARFMSIKGGHELDVEFARQLEKQLKHEV